MYWGVFVGARGEGLAPHASPCIPSRPGPVSAARHWVPPRRLPQAGSLRASLSCPPSCPPSPHGIDATVEPGGTTVFSGHGRFYSPPLEAGNPLAMSWPAPVSESESTEAPGTGDTFPRRPAPWPPHAPLPSSPQLPTTLQVLTCPLTLQPLWTPRGPSHATAPNPVSFSLPKVPMTLVSPPAQALIAGGPTALWLLVPIPSGALPMAPLPVTPTGLVLATS